LILINYIVMCRQFQIQSWKM